MRVKMRDTTRHQNAGQLLAGHVYEVEDAVGEHLVGVRLAVKTQASVTDDTSLDEPDDGALDTPRGGMVTREDAAGLTGDAEQAPAPRRTRS